MRQHPAAPDLVRTASASATTCSPWLHSYIVALTRRDIMTIIRHAPAGLVASGVFALGLFYAGAVTYGAPVANELMLVNAKTGKCLTIAGGVSTDNNVESVQFDCDSDPSRRWTLDPHSIVTCAAEVTPGRRLRSPLGIGRIGHWAANALTSSRKVTFESH